MPDTNRITELQTALDEKVRANDAISDAFRVDGGTVVVTAEQRDQFRKNLSEAQEIKSLLEEVMLTDELKELSQAELTTAAERIEEMKTAAQEAGVETKGLDPATLAAAAASYGQMKDQNANPFENKSLGAAFTESKEFQELLTSGGLTMRQEWQVQGADIGSKWAGEQKDVYTASMAGTTTRGFGTFQRDAMVPRQFQQARVRDLFPVQTTTANLIDFFRVTGFTNAAAPVPERTTGAFTLKPQSALTFAPGQAPVRTIAHWEAAHRNVLADEPQLRGVIDNELLYGLRLTEDEQILSGDGTGENLLGILNTSGIQLVHGNTSGGTPAGIGLATDNKADTIRRAATRAILAYYEPTGVVLHPFAWEDIELTKDDNERYLITGAVAVGAQQMLWRMPVVDTPAMPQANFLVGAFGLGAQLYDRELASIRIAEQHADFFVRNAVVILAEQRLALAVKRPESFVKGTFSTGS